MKNLYKIAAAAAALAATSLLAWAREPLRGVRPLADYVSAALTTGTSKYEWIMGQPGEIVGLRIDSGGAGVGAGNSTIDVMINGTSIYAVNAKPVIAAASTGDWTVLPPDTYVKAAFKAGDIIRYDVTGIPGTSGHTRTKIIIETLRR